MPNILSVTFNQTAVLCCIRIQYGYKDSVFMPYILYVYVSIHSLIDVKIAKPWQVCTDFIF